MKNSKITEIPTRANQGIKNFLFAPVEPTFYAICIEGKKIPRMLGREVNGKYEIMLDGRFMYIFDTVESAYTACSMAANALAIGEGYPWLGAEKKEQPFAPTIMGIEAD